MPLMPRKAQPKSIVRMSMMSRRAAAGSLRGPDGEHDGQAAADQDGGIGSAECRRRWICWLRRSHRSTSGGRSGRRRNSPPKNMTSVARKIHMPRFGGVALLLLGGEVVEQRRVVAVMRRCAVMLWLPSVWLSDNVEPPACGRCRSRRSCRLPRSRPALPRN